MKNGLLVGLLTTVLLLSIPFSGQSQTTSRGTQASQRLSSRRALWDLERLADEDHKTGHIEAEITHRQQVSQTAWAMFAFDEKSLDRFDRYSIIFFNDMPLGILLESLHRYPEAEAILRHNQAELNLNRLAGDDIKSENQLQLAHLLAREGKDKESKQICSHWKKRVIQIGKQAVRAAKQSEPSPPFYDTPEVEVAAWDLACGKSEEGLKSLAEQFAAYPHMLYSFAVLRNYYYSEGNIQKAHKMELDGISAVTLQ